jgi:hypothetical protein
MAGWAGTRFNPSMAILTGALWLVAGIGIPAYWLWHCWLWLRRGYTQLWPAAGGLPFLRRDAKPLLYWTHLGSTAFGSAFVGTLGWAFASAMLFC